MKKKNYFFLLALFPMLSQAAPVTTYRTADHYPYSQQYGRSSQTYVAPYSAQNATQWYKGTPQAQYHPNDRRYPPRRPQFSVVTPHVEVYVHSETQQYYQRTEEVYLPYGGTYRSVTEHVPVYSHPNYGQPKVIIRGNFYAE